MVQDLRVSPARPVTPFVPQAGGRQCRRAVARRKVPRLFSIRRVLPFVVTRHRYKAAGSFKYLAKEGLLSYRLRARVERRQLDLFDRFCATSAGPNPSALAQARAYRRAQQSYLPDRWDRRCSAPGVPRRLVERQPVEPDDLFPRQAIGKASAHEPEYNPFSKRMSPSGV